MLNPEQVLNNLQLKANMSATEFGSGAGGFSIPLAKRLRQGKVYALDILEEKLSALKNKATLEKIANIETIICNLEAEKGSTLHRESQDIVLIPNILFQAEDEESMMKEAKRILKQGGELLVLDWKKESPLGPREGRISKEEVKEIAEKIGLKLKKEFSPGDYHYGLIFTK